MSFDAKKKVMLAVLAGGMLNMNGAMADNVWYGASDNAVTWNGVADVFDIPETACTTGADLTLDGAGTYGGIAFADVDQFIGGIDMGDGNVTQNLITVTGGVFAANRFIACGNTYLGDVTNNSIIILDGNFGENNTFEAGFSNEGTVSSNAVTISDGDFGASNKFYGGFNYSGDVTGNTVTISGGTFGNSNKFYGGFRYGGDVTGDVTGNTVTISGGDFGANVEIYGGMIEDGYTGDAINNTVEISGGDFSDGYKLYGGWCCLGTGSGNTLNLKTKMSGKASHVALFQIMNFTLPSDIANGDTMLKTQLLQVSDSDNTATVNVDAANGVSLKKGDVITLIDSDETYEHYAAGDILGGAAEFYSEADAGEDKNGDGDQKDLVITLLQDFEQKKSAGNEDQQKAPVEGIAAGVAMINQSADLASGEGMQNLLKNTGNFDKTETNYNIDTFGAVTGSRTKYKTGSHVDMDGWGFLVGVGTTKKWTHAGKTTYGVFFEYGKGDFDTYNNTIHGEGDSNNKGVGVIARHTLKNNTYIDGAVRYGKQETEWSESEIGGYDTDSRYYGVALGLGHIYSLGKNEIDVYGRYSFGHTGASDAKVKDSDYHFDSVKSHRLRVGTKLNIIVKGKKVKPYVGLAWEHEFNGESKASITGAGEAPAPSLKGHTGIMQAGCSWETGKWTLGAEANAYIGKRKGWGGMLNAFYNF